MNEDEARKFVEKYFSYVDGKQMEQLMELFAEDGKIDFHGRVKQGKQAIREFLWPAIMSWREMKHTITKLTVSGNEINIELITSGVDPSGKPVKRDEKEYFKVENEKIKDLKLSKRGP